MIRRPALTRPIAVACAAALGVCAPMGAQAGAQGGWQANEDDALILELHSGSYRLGDTLRGYQTPQGICVDMADLIQAMDLPVRLDRKSRRATGWLFEESERFTLDREAFTVQNVNSERQLGAGAIQDTPEGWCADLGALSGWFGVTFRPDLSNMRVVIETQRKLPFLQAIERRSRAARLSARKTGFDLASLPRTETPYRSWRAPSVDVMITTALRSAGSGTNSELRYEAYATGEALGMSYDARFASDYSGVPASLRLRAYRNDPAGNLLGPIRATQVALGDVETFAGNLTGQSAVGRGVFVSNRPLQQPSRFGVTTLRGEMPAGWDAELYRNGQLFAFQADRGDGRYEFKDVELLFGDNAFEVVLYGPQGQIRRDRSDVPVGAEAIPAGKTWYWAGIIDQGRDLIDFSHRFADPHTGWRWGVGVERGIDKRTSAGVEYQSMVFENRRHDFIEARVRRALGPMLVELSGAQLLGQGRAWKAQAIGKLGPVRFQAETMWIDGGYESEQVDPDDKRLIGLRLDSDLKFGKTTIPVAGSFSQNLSRDGTKVTEWLTRVSIASRRLALTGYASYRSSVGPSAVPDDDGMRVGLLANTMIGKVALRGDARFRLSGSGQRGLEAAQVAVDTTLSGRSSLRGMAEYRPADRAADFTLAWLRRFRHFSLRSEAKLGTRGNYGVGLSVIFGMGPDPVDGGWRFTADKLVRAGQAVVTVYRDENGNGRRDGGEEPVEGVEIEGAYGLDTRVTNGEGKVVVDGLRPFVPVRLAVETDSLPDPLLMPKGRGVVVVPRPGIPSEIALALAPTGQVEGMLLAVDGTPREGAEIELVDEKGLAIAKTVSEFDGYFLFDSAPYGAYRLRLGESTASALGVRREMGPALVLDRAKSAHHVGTLRLENAEGTTTLAVASP